MYITTIYIFWKVQYTKLHSEEYLASTLQPVNVRELILLFDLQYQLVFTLNLFSFNVYKMELPTGIEPLNNNNICMSTKTHNK
jgi:hypothetical protein